MADRYIGKYKFIKRLGQGGMGQVFHAKDETLDRYFTLEMVTDEGFAERFKRVTTCDARALTIFQKCQSCRA